MNEELYHALEYIEQLEKAMNKQDTEINKLNNVIDRMAEYIAPLKTKDGVKWTEIGVKKHFMKEDK